MMGTFWRRLSGGCAALLLLTGSLWAEEFPARLDWQRRVVLGTPVSGVIARVDARAGQRVARGALLVELDPRLFRAALARARADRQQAQSAREEARRELERTLELFDRAMLSVHDRQLAQIADVDAEAALVRADAALTEARVSLEYSRLTAPFDALVLEVPAQVGETVVSRLQARTLVVLAPAERMRAIAWVAAETLAGLAPGAPARVVVEDRALDGQLAEVGLEPRPGSEVRPLYPVAVDFQVPEGVVLRAGQAVAIRVR